MRSHKQGEFFRSNIYTSTTDSKVSELPLIHNHLSSVYKTMMPTQPQDTFSEHHINEVLGKSMKNNHDMNANTFGKSLNAILLDKGKHPVNKVKEIMELLNKNKVEYSYLEDNEKLEDAQYFKCIAKSKSINAYGSGVSKKDAKKNAAIDFINKLQSNLMAIYNEEEKNCLAEQEVNYVGILQNFCVAVPSQLPDYECEEDDENLNNMFIVKCHLYGYTTKGEGKSKQTAKKKAAAIMYNQIKDMPRDVILKQYVNECKIPSRDSEKIDDSANHTLMQSSIIPKTMKYSGNHRLIQPNRVSEKVSDSVKHVLMQPRKVSEEKNDSVNQTLIKPSKFLEKTNGYTVNHTLKQPSRISEKMYVPGKHPLMQPRKLLDEKNDSVNKTLMQPSSNVQKYCNSKNHTITEEYISENSIMTKSKDSVLNNLDSFFDQMKSSKKPTLSRLREIKRIQLCTIDTIQMLYDIGNEENFTVNYESMPNQSSSFVKVKVNLSVSPTLIHLGSGTSVINAFKEASFNVLVYLKMIMNESKP